MRRDRAVGPGQGAEPTGQSRAGRPVNPLTQPEPSREKTDENDVAEEAPVRDAAGAGEPVSEPTASVPGQPKRDAGVGTSAGPALPAARRAIGRNLGTRRRAAGMTQHQLGVRVAYSRTTVEHVENGMVDTTLVFWERCDRVLDTGGYFASWYRSAYPDRASSSVAPGDPAGTLPSAGLTSARSSEVLAAFGRAGWPVAVSPRGGLALETGTVADALEVPSGAGRIAARWWAETGGESDLVRGLPSLPPLVTHMAVIASADRWYWLVEPGACPWPDLTPRPHGGDGSPGVTWHADGGSVPIPPGEDTAWAFLPAAEICLPPALAVLHLLGQACSLVRGPATLALPGGTLVTPAGIQPG